MPRVFLSRTLRAASPFHKLKDLATWQLEAKSLLEFTSVPVKEVPVTDWLFFYSAKGVEMFLSQKKVRPNQKLACLGKGAARYLSHYNLAPNFVGNGVPEDTARQMQERLQDENITFIQARHSRASVQKMLPDGDNHQALIVYDNQPLTSFDITPADYLIFTSPLNFEAYLQRYPLKSDQRFIGIGNTTAVTFSEANVKQYRIASEPRESALLSCLLTWEQDHPLH